MGYYRKKIINVAKTGAAFGANYVKSLIPSKGPGIKFSKPSVSSVMNLQSVANHLRQRKRARNNYSGGSALSAASVRLPKTRYKKGNRPKPKKQFKVKVSKDFKRKVLAVSEVNHIFGYGQENYLITTLGVADNTNFTSVADNVFNPSPNLGGLFSWVHILHCASRLWNQKSATAAPVFADPLMFPNAIDQKVTVRRQWAICRMKNNSERTVRVKLLLCSPKHLQVNQGPFPAWINAVTEMQASGALVSSGTVFNSLYTHPKMYPSFNAQYSASETDYVLEPGQSVEQHVEGPSMVYEGRKFYVDGSYQLFQKQDIIPLVIITSDVINNTTPTYGHVSTGTARPYEKLLFETTYHVKMSMPEPTGWISGGVAPAAGPVVLTNRVKRMFIDEFNLHVNTAGLDEHRVDEMNPTNHVIA